jgi:hypothetical protein
MRRSIASAGREQADLSERLVPPLYRRRAAPPTEEQRDQENHEEDEEQDLRNPCGGARNAAEAENAGDKGDNQKNYGPVKHDLSLVTRARRPFL